MKVLLISTLLFFSTAALISPSLRGRQQSHPLPTLPELEQKERQGPLSVDESVRLAKLRGNTTVTIAGLQVLYVVYDDLDDALAHSMLVHAELLEKQSFRDDASPGGVATLYKFKCLEQFSKPTRPLKTYTSISDTRGLTPANEEEFLIIRPGGTIVVDGIRVTVAESGFPEFEVAHKYLLLVSIDPSTRVADLQDGPIGVLIAADDGSVRSLDGQANRFHEDLQKRFGASLDEMKWALKRTRFSPE